jgi:hypothetical protein
MLLTIVFILTILIVIYNPKYGVFAIFIYWIIFSNAMQSNLFQWDKSGSSPYSIIPLANNKFIDQQGLRFLILILFLSVLVKSVKKGLKEIWILKFITIIVLVSISSIIVNSINYIEGFSSISLFLVSFLFLFSALNIKFTEKDIITFFNFFYFFLIINSVFQIHQYLFFSSGDVDLTMGLLSGTVQTPILAYVFSIFYYSFFILGKTNKYIFAAIYLLIIQLVSSYLKGLISVAFVVILMAREIATKGTRAIILIGIGLTLLFSISAYIFTDAVKDYSIFYEFNSVNQIMNLGPIKVWTQYFELVGENPQSLIFGYGPSSYGSSNTSDEKGFGNSKLGELIEIAGVGNLAGRDIFGRALSIMGNILWEFGGIVLFLFFYIYYRIYRETKYIFKKSKSDLLKVYAFGVKYNIIFLILIYFLQIGGSETELFLWGPIFVVFSYIKQFYNDEQSINAIII